MVRPRRQRPFPPRVLELLPVGAVTARRAPQPLAFEPPEHLRRRAARPPGVLLDRRVQFREQLFIHFGCRFVNLLVTQLRVQPGERPVEGGPAAGVLDLLARVFQRFELQYLLQVEAEWALDVALERRRAEHRVGAEADGQVGQHRGVGQPAVVGHRREHGPPVRGEHGRLEVIAAHAGRRDPAPGQQAAARGRGVNQPQPGPGLGGKSAHPRAAR